MYEARVHNKQRLEPLFVKLLYKDSIKLYVSDIGLFYNIHYNRLKCGWDLEKTHKFAFVLLGCDEIVLCKIAISHIQGRYRATEVPLAFKRIKSRILIITPKQIIGYLTKCLKQ